MFEFTIGIGVHILISLMYSLLCCVLHALFPVLMKNRSGVTGIELSRWLAAINQASVLLLWFVAASAPVQSGGRGPPASISLISSSDPRTLIVRTFGFDWFLKWHRFGTRFISKRYVVPGCDTTTSFHVTPLYKPFTLPPWSYLRAEG